MKLTFTTTLLCAAYAPALAQDAALERCRAIEAPAARLACYDTALPPRVAAPRLPGPAAAATLPAAPAAAPVATAPVPAMASSAKPTVAAAPPPAPASPPPVTEPQANFGFESRRRTAEEAPDRVLTSYQGTFSGWGPIEKIPLANGQVWQIADGSQTAYDIKNPVVRIVRGAFGSFFMEIEGVSHSPKVRRVQ